MNGRLVALALFTPLATVIVGTALLSAGVRGLMALRGRGAAEADYWVARWAEELRREITSPASSTDSR